MCVHSSSNPIGPQGHHRVVDPFVAFRRMAQYTTIALRAVDKQRLDSYIRETFGTDPKETPYRLAINHLLDNNMEETE